MEEREQEALDQEAVEKLQEKYSKVKGRNTKALESWLAKLPVGVDIIDIEGAIEDFRSIERSDYDTQEDYLEDRSSAWDEIMEAVDSL